MPTRSEQYNAQVQQITNALNQTFGNDVISGPNLIDSKERNVVTRNETEDVSPNDPGPGCTTIKYSYDRNYEFQVTHRVVVAVGVDPQTGQIRARSFKLVSRWMPVTDEHVEYTVIECPGVFDLEIPENYVIYEEESDTIGYDELLKYKREPLIVTNKEGRSQTATLTYHEIIDDGIDSRIKLSLKII